MGENMIDLLMADKSQEAIVLHKKPLFYRILNYCESQLGRELTFPAKEWTCSKCGNRDDAWFHTDRSSMKDICTTCEYKEILKREREEKKRERVANLAAMILGNSPAMTDYRGISSPKVSVEEAWRLAEILYQKQHLSKKM